MHALTVVDEVGTVQLRDWPPPDSRADRVRVRVGAFSLNRGEARLVHTAPVGTRPGWDFAGILLDDVPGGIGKGARVVGVAEGGTWAETVSVKPEWIASIPDTVSDKDAAAVATAGLTALRTLRLSGASAGSRMLITGANGGVGRLAVQLAANLGCHVCALVSRNTDASKIEALGADDVAADLRDFAGTFDNVLESIGGGTLGQAVARLSSTGTVVAFGNSSGEPTTFDVRDFYDGAMRTLRGFELFHDPDPFGPDLTVLLTSLEDGVLDPQVVGVLPWNDIAAAIARLEHRSVGGKLVLRVDRADQGRDARNQERLS